MNDSEVKKFADLARIEISEADLAKMAGEIEEVLEYVGQLKNAAADSSERKIESAAVRNVFRVDEKPHSRAVNKEKILESAPEKEGDYFKVKKIL